MKKDIKELRMKAALREERMKALISELSSLAEENEHYTAEGRVHTLFSVEQDEDRFLLVNGSAHMMEELFVKFLEARPEFCSVVRSALMKNHHYV